MAAPREIDRPHAATVHRLSRRNVSASHVRGSDPGSWPGGTRRPVHRAHVRRLPRMAGVANGALSIAHISDLHCGGPHFVPTLLERAISEINDMKPDLVVCSGDLTTFGFKPEYVQAKSYLDKIECESLVIVPGNHDARNVGYVHFEEMFGDRSSVLHLSGVSVVAVDSTEPDLDHGEIGRGRYPWIEEQLSH